MLEQRDILDLQKRREIYEFISHNSGLHMRDISRKLDIPFTTLKYHLKYLENNDFILSRKDGKYNRYFVSLEVSEKEKRILSCFRKKTTLYIILWFFIIVQCSQKELSKYLEKHPATIGFHLRTMKNAGLIEQKSFDEGMIQQQMPPYRIKRSPVSSEKVYMLSDPWMVYDLLVKHKDRLEDTVLVNGIIEYVEFYLNRGAPQEVKNREDTKKEVVATLYNFFFPPSFCY